MLYLQWFPYLTFATSLTVTSYFFKRKCSLQSIFFALYLNKFTTSQFVFVFPIFSSIALAVGSRHEDVVFDSRKNIFLGARNEETTSFLRRKQIVVCFLA